MDEHDCCFNKGKTDSLLEKIQIGKSVYTSTVQYQPSFIDQNE